MVQTEDVSHAVGFSDELKPGTTLLRGQYTIETYLNSGGFGITYLARDSLDRVVVIKECFPGSFCRRADTIVRPRSRSHQNEFRAIVNLFVQEARNLSKLQHPGIVGVHQVFEDNDTAYMALDFVDGRDLLDIIEEEEDPFTPEEINNLLLKSLEAIGFVHQNNLLHRDISPDNILLDSSGNPVLIDFGAAREEATRKSRALSTMLVVKDGYSPQEFYIAGSAQNPSSDLYALGATFYHMITGQVPPNSQARLAAIAAADEDPYLPLSVIGVDGYEIGFLESIDKSLNVLPKDRFATAQEWIDRVQTLHRNEAMIAQARMDESIHRVVTDLVETTNRDIEKIRAEGKNDEPMERSRRGRSVKRRNLTRPVIPPDPYAEDDGDARPAAAAEAALPAPEKKIWSPIEAVQARHSKKRAAREAALEAERAAAMVAEEGGHGARSSEKAKATGLEDADMNIYELTPEDAGDPSPARPRRLALVGIAIFMVFSIVAVSQMLQQAGLSVTGLVNDFNTSFQEAEL
ncbi:MAG: serine/threonine-protein kinase [Pseudomonadota bacterium]